MKIDLPGWIKRNIRAKLEGDLHNNVTLTIECGVLSIRLVFPLEEFQQMLGELLGEMGDEWAIMDYLVTLLADKQSSPDWETEAELPETRIKPPDWAETPSFGSYKLSSGTHNGIEEEES